MQQKNAGLTLLELLVALSLLMLLMTLATQMLVGSLSTDRQTRDRVPSQQGVRSSMELLAQELRGSIGPKVNYVPTGQTAALRPELTSTDHTSITLFLASAGTAYPAVPPAGYPSVGIWGPRTATGVTGAGTCPEITTGRYLAVYSTVGTTSTSPAQKLADASRIVVASADGCPSGVVSHSATDIQTYNSNTYVMPVTPITYSLKNGVLTRTIAGQGPQVVFDGLTSLSFRFQPEITDLAAGCDATQFYDTPTCVPGAVLISLTARPKSSATDLTMQQVVFLH